jgi:predicted nuclease with TOPRIM domain
LKLDLNKQSEQKAKETVSKDLSVEELKQTNEKLNQNLSKRNEETKSLKSKLNELMTRVNEVEHEKLQSNLDWQHKYQYLENIKAQDSEQFTKQILESRDQVIILYGIMPKLFIFQSENNFVSYLEDRISFLIISNKFSKTFNFEV